MNQKTSTLNQNFLLWDRIEPILQQFQPNNKILLDTDKRGWITCFSPFQQSTEPRFMIKPDYKQHEGEFIDMLTFQKGSLAELCSLLQISTEDLTIQQEPSYPFHIFSCHQYLTEKPKKVWLVPTLIGPQDMIMFYGASGSGKSLVLLDFLICSTQGRAWANQFTFNKPLKVLLCIGEGQSSIPNRLLASIHTHKTTSTIVGQNLTICDSVPQLFHSNGPEITERFIDAVLSINETPDMIAIDTLSRAMLGANENSAQDMNIVVSQLDKIKKELSCALLLVHHSDKTGTHERGSTVLKAAMDAQIEISKNKSQHKMSCKKHRHAEEFGDLFFQTKAFGSEQELCSITWGDNLTQKEQLSTKQNVLTLISQHPKITARHLEELTSLSRQAINKHLQQLQQEGVLIKTRTARGAFAYEILCKNSEL